MPQRPSTYDFTSRKGRQKWVQLHVDTAAEATAALEAGVILLGCEAETLPAIRAAAPTAFLQAGTPHGATATPDDAIRAGFALLAQGADTIYCSHSPRFIEAMAREGIPVTGHVGLVPNLARFTNFRAIGRTAEEAAQVVQKVRDIENAGASFLEVEVVPVELADHITRTTKMITMGMGCGTVCDTQYLFSCDVLGTNTGHYPRHSKRYADFAALEAELQAKRVEAFRAFTADVAASTYPEDRHLIRMSPDEHEKFLQAVQAA
jgi:3-methyl-2-oxobutanoate hydroxymethyltransferase